jgi:virginiamycin B lyase
VRATLFGTNKLARINPDTFELTEVVLPRADARPRRLEITSDGLVWYVDYAQGYLGRLDPVTGAITEWPTPSGCGSHLFWKPSNEDYIGILAASVDEPSGLRMAKHIFVDDKGDYYEITDGLPQYAGYDRPLKSE